MGIHVMGLTSTGGLPLFVRQKGNAQALPFSLVASMNGVHMFCKTNHIKLINTISKDVTVIWKDFEDSITLITVSTINDIDLLSELLEFIFNAIILTVGLDEIKNNCKIIKNIERFKRDIRCGFPLIDRLLENIDLASSTRDHRSNNFNNVDLLSFIETILCNESVQLKNCLDAFAECVESLFACLLLGNCIMVATAGWWELTSEERKLLSTLIDVNNNNCTSTDIPVFLPKKSPTVPFRLVTCNVINSIKVVALCGPTPLLSIVEQQVGKCWRPAVELLKIVQSTTTINVSNSNLMQTIRSIPNNIQLHHGVTGILLINCIYGKYILSRNLFNNKKESSDILRTFYYQSAPLLTNRNSYSGNVKGVETYWCSEFHKLHGLSFKENIVCMLYSSGIPTHTMRYITRQTLTNIVSEKQFCW